MPKYFFIQYKEHFGSFQSYCNFLEMYMEGEYYLEIDFTTDEKNIGAVGQGNTGETIMDACDISKYSDKTNPSAFFVSSDENSLSQELSQDNNEHDSAESSNTSEIINVINKTHASNKMDASKRELLKLFNDFNQYTNAFLEEHKFEPTVHMLKGRTLELGLFDNEINLKAAVMEYQLAVKLNNTLGIFYLARCYEFGIGVEKEKESARDLYRTVAKQGHHRGLYRYALICLKNEDVQLGLNYLRQAVLAKEKEIKRNIKNNPANNTDSNLIKNINNCPYFYHLGTLYMIKHSQLIRDMSYAYSVFLKGAKYKCKHSLFMVAEFNEKGTVIPKDMVTAYKNYAEVAALGQSDAQIKIGKLLISKSNIKINKKDLNIGNDSKCLMKDIELGFTYLEMSAFSGNSKGMVALADAFYQTSDKRDVLQAYWWYKIAETFGENVTEQLKRVENYIEHTKHNGF